MSRFSFDINANISVDDVLDLFEYRVVIGHPAFLFGSGDRVYDYPVTNIARAMEMYARGRLVVSAMGEGSFCRLSLVSKDAPMFFVTLFEYVR